MAYGLEVRAANGQARLYETSWFMNFHSNRSYTVGPNSSQDVIISGFDPDRWGLARLVVEPQGDFNLAGRGYVSLHTGYIRLTNYGDYEDIRFDFMVLKGN